MLLAPNIGPDYSQFPKQPSNPMNQIACPDEEQLRDYVLGKLAEDVAEQTERHLQVCQACEATAESLETQVDSLIEQIRQPSSDDPYLAEPQCQVALAKAKLLVGKVLFGDRQPKDLAPGQPASLGRLGEYELLAKLGEGGMGVVYKARQTRLKKIVALKVLPKERTADPRTVTRFEREMEAIGQLAHPNIVQAYDARDIEATTVLVMEYVDGKDLGELLKCVQSLRISDACEVVRQAALGLQYAHEHGLVHRDIKPSNLMLTTLPSPVLGRGAGGEGGMGIVKILDLGLALLGTDQCEGGELTGTGAAMGTADYMAPEQVSDAHAVDIRADIYGLGCTLYKLLTGQAPFSGPQYKTNVEKLVGHLKETPPPVRQLRSDVPPELAKVIERMMAKSPHDRFAAPAEVAAAIAPFAAGCDLARLSAEAAAAEGGVAREQPSVVTEAHVSSGVAGTHAGASLPSPVLGRGRAPCTHGRGEGGPHRHWLGAKGIIALTLAAIVLFGVLITVATRHGTLEIVTDDPNVQVAVKQNGEDVEVVDATSGWKIRLKSGQYELALQGSTDQLQLDQDSVVVKRGDTVKVKVTLKQSNSPRPGHHVPMVAGEGPGVRVLDQPPLPTIGSLIGADGKWKLPPGAPQPAIAPFHAQKAKEHQEAWAKHLGVPVEQTNSIGMKLVFIPPGEFEMGSSQELIEEELKSAGEDKWYREHLADEEPRHRVRITRPFYLGMYLVTQEEYQRVMGANPSAFSATGNSKDKVAGQDTKQFPVEMVPWQDADEFCSRLSETAAEKSAGRRYRLPSEAQWEYACRAGSTGRFSFGPASTVRTGAEEKKAAESLLPEYAWFRDNSGAAARGGRKASQPVGIVRHVWECVGVVSGLVRQGLLCEVGDRRSGWTSGWLGPRVPRRLLGRRRRRLPVRLPQPLREWIPGQPHGPACLPSFGGHGGRAGENEPYRRYRTTCKWLGRRQATATC